MEREIVSVRNVLKDLLKQFNINEAQLARALGMPRATINRLLSGRSPDPKASLLRAIANYFDISVDQLLGLKPLNLDHQIYNESLYEMAVPLIQWEDAYYWSNKKNSFSFYNHDEWLLVGFDKCGVQYALNFSGVSMEPEIKSDTFLLIDPMSKPRNYDYGLVYIADRNEIVLRQFIQEGHYYILRPANNMFSIVYLQDQDEILGVIVESRRQYK
jgi:transcriptional regulator with XRE-family HTH domain